MFSDDEDLAADGWDVEINLEEVKSDVNQEFKRFFKEPVVKVQEPPNKEDLEEYIAETGSADETPLVAN